MKTTNIELIIPNSWFFCVKIRVIKEFSLAGVRIPSGFICDGVSVSRWFAPVGLLFLILAIVTNNLAIGMFGLLLNILPTIFPRLGSCLLAAIVHDYCLTNLDISRLEADKKYKKALEELSVSRWRIICMYFGVSFWSLLVWGRK